MDSKRLLSIAVIISLFSLLIFSPRLIGEEGRTESPTRTFHRDHPALEKRRALQREMYDLAIDGSDVAFSELAEYSVSDDPQVRRMTALALGRSSHNESFALLLSLLDDEDKDVRGAAAIGLGFRKNEQAHDALINALENDESSEVKGRAVFALGQLGTEKATDKVIASLESDISSVRKNAASTLARSEDKKVIEPLIKTLLDKEDLVRERAAKSLKKLTGNEELYEKTDNMSVEDSHQAWQAWWEENKDTFKIASPRRHGSTNTAKRWLEQYDADKDGALNEAELETALSSMRKSARVIRKGEPIKTDVTLKDLNGEEVKLGDVLSGTTVIYYFSPKCSYCIKAEAFIKQLHADYNDTGVKILGIASSRETLEGLKTYLKRVEFEFPVIRDYDRQFSRKNSISGTPNVLIVDEAGKIQDYYRGLPEENRKKLTQALSKLTSKP